MPSCNTLKVINRDVGGRKFRACKLGRCRIYSVPIRVGEFTSRKYGAI